MAAILVTRPLPDADETRAALEALGHQVVCDPILDIRTLPWEEPDWAKIDGVIVTSRNAIYGFAGHLVPKSTMFSLVGERTQETLRRMGYVHVTGTVDRADDLPPLIRVQHPAGAHLLHLTAAHARDKFYAPLAAEGYRITAIQLYEAVAAESFRPQTIAALKTGDLDTALFYSARSAEIFHELAAVAGLSAKLKSMRAVCLSAAIADSFERTLWGDVQVAARPTQQHMLDCLAIPQR